MSINIPCADLEPGYYGITDPHDGTITHWYRSKKNPVVKSWPSKAKPGPRALRSDVPKPKEEREAWLQEYWTKQREYREAVLDAIVADPDAASARFAAWNSRCSQCGKTLEDPKSKCYGIGPECRSAYPDWVLAAMSARMSKVLASGVPDDD